LLFLEILSSWFVWCCPHYRNRCSSELNLFGNCRWCVDADRDPDGLVARKLFPRRIPVLANLSTLRIQIRLLHVVFANLSVAVLKLEYFEHWCGFSWDSRSSKLYSNLST
jgi:hypothetical protein